MQGLWRTGYAGSFGGCIRCGWWVWWFLLECMGVTTRCIFALHLQHLHPRRLTLHITHGTVTGHPFSPFSGSLPCSLPARGSSMGLGARMPGVKMPASAL